MALHIPRWIKTAGIVVAGIAAVGAALARKVDMRERIMGQTAAPHGALG